VVNVSVVRDDLLDDGRSNLRLWWRWWEWSRRRGRRTLLPASDDDLVFDHFALATRWRGVSATDYELLPLSCDHFPTHARRRQTPLAISNDQSVFMLVTTIATVLAVFVLEDDIFLVCFAAPWRRAVSEPDLLALDLDFARPWGRATTSAEYNVLTLYLTGWRGRSRS
jgi:hypothetical protein